jgi:hypothetical protein
MATAENPGLRTIQRHAYRMSLSRVSKVVDQGSGIRDQGSGF